jgi:drug/metabolite transporter (DMT)-like permease
LFAGFMGAFASQFWFLGFSLTSAANVRTLGLVEVLFAQIVSRRVFSQAATQRELAGIALIVAGVAVLLIYS